MMKLIKETEAIYKGKQRVRQGLFECPYCKQETIKRLSAGVKQKSCGSKECKSLALAHGSKNRDKSVYANRTTHGLSSLEYYDRVRTIYRRFNDRFSLEEFFSLVYDKYARLKELEPDLNIYVSIDDSNEVRVSTSKLTKSTVKNHHIDYQRKNGTANSSVQSKTYKSLVDAANEKSIFNSARLGFILGIRSDNIERHLRAKYNNDSTMRVEEVKYGKNLTTNVVFFDTEEAFNKAVQHVLAGSKTVVEKYVYLMKSKTVIDDKIRDIYKIGISSDVEKRNSGLNGASPINIEIITSCRVPNANIVEKLLHKEYAEYHSHFEWFLLPNEEASKIEEALSSCAIDEFVTERIIKRLEREAIKNNLLSNMKKNLAKLQKKHEEREYHDKVATQTIDDEIIKSTHKKKTGFKNKPYIVEATRKKVYQFTLNGELLAVYDSTMIAQEETGINHISSVCRGDRKQAGGYLWSYKPTIEPPKNVRLASSMIAIKDGISSTYESKKECSLDIGIAQMTLARRLKDGKEWNGYTFEYCE
jgi:ribosomal protein L37AE/L43A